MLGTALAERARQSEQLLEDAKDATQVVSVASESGFIQRIQKLFRLPSL